MRPLYERITTARLALGGLEVQLFMRQRNPAWPMTHGDGELERRVHELRDELQGMEMTAAPLTPNAKLTGDPLAGRPVE